MPKGYPPVYYSDYLQLEKILSGQKPKSTEYGKPAHDEMLFIIVHQVYELWFKLIIHELDSIIRIFGSDSVDEKNIGISVARIRRIIEIQNLLLGQLKVLETLTPLDFLDFRDYLIPASGFQSFQFRLIENKLGLGSENRIHYNNEDYLNTLSDDHRRLILDSMEDLSLFELVEKWLERTPFTSHKDFDFWRLFRSSAEKMLENEHIIIENNKTLSEDKKRVEHENLRRAKENYDALFDDEKYKEMIKKGDRRLSNRAILSALFISMYRDEPILHMPYMFLTSLMDMDELFTSWRYRHALMVHRMIGSKVGTGGSSGHKYLMATVEKHRVFTDLFSLSTYIIPRSELPELPEDLVKQLGFYYSG